METRTKIICTIGPSVSSLESVLRLIDSGMNVARLNFSHGTHEQHRESIHILKQAREQTKKPLAIMLDTKGPEIRTGKVVPEGVEVSQGMRLLLVRDKDIVGDSSKISVRPDIVIDYLKPGTLLLIDNGYIQAKVVEVNAQGAVIEFLNSGTILSSKGMNVPDIDIPLPALTEKDISDIEFGCREGIDIIAASFIRNADHVVAIKKLITQFARPDILVIAKLENSEGIYNFDNILHVADGVMVARGDLGVEVPLSQVPRLQKMMIRKSNLIGKPSVTATQMLESMIQNPRPTRAEVSDVANAIYDGTSAVMLSGETAVGKYPFDTVNIMRSIVKEAEQDFNYPAFFDMHAKLTYSDIPSALTLATVKTAVSLGAKAIFTLTHSGATARLLSRLKPPMPIIALTSNETTFHQLGISWGVIPVHCNDHCTSMDEAFQWASRYGIELGMVSHGDLIVLTAGSPMWIPGTSNTILVDCIGDVLLRGEKGVGQKLYAPVSLVPAANSIKPYTVRGSIIVIPKYDESLSPLIHEASGVILENAPDDLTSAGLLFDICKKEGKSAIIGTTNALKILRDGQLVTLDTEKAIVYKGVNK